VLAFFSRSIQASLATHNSMDSPCSADRRLVAMAIETCSTTMSQSACHGLVAPDRVLFRGSARSTRTPARRRVKEKPVQHDSSYSELCSVLSRLPYCRHLRIVIRTMEYSIIRVIEESLMEEQHTANCSSDKGGFCNDGKHWERFRGRKYRSARAGNRGLLHKP